MDTAKYYYNLGGDVVMCSLCPHQCKISPGRIGVCGVRENRGGVLISENYGVISSWGIDPIEKKPLYHYYPGKGIFSIGSYGCNFKCKFCQNWQIAQQIRIPEARVSPKEIVERASSIAGNVGIAYTYNEPLVGFEFVLDCSKLAHERGLKNVLVTNGFIEGEPLDELIPYIDAMNIDIKGNETFYKDVIAGRLAPVKATVERAHGKCHVEITNLIIPGVNDDDDEIEELAQWISTLSPSIPLHISRYFPSYKLDLPPTPVATVERARLVALRHLDYVYTGNGGDPQSANTFCPDCGHRVILRSGTDILVELDGGRCPKCGEGIL